MGQLKSAVAQRRAREAAARRNGAEVVAHNDPIEDDVVVEIIEGGHDATLDQIYDAIRERWDILQRQRAAVNRGRIRPGVTVRTAEQTRLRNAKPGQILGEVVPEPGRTRRTKVAVKLTANVGRFQAGETVIFPLSAVEPVE
jgi:hypothetical protein